MMKTRYKMLFDIHIKSNIFSSTVVMIRHERISSLSHLKNLSRYLCALDWIAHHLCSKKRYSRTRYARFEPRFSSNPDHKKKRPKSLFMCPGLDSNQHGCCHNPLKIACLPISPPGHRIKN